jgi:hypothetical protein
MKMLLVHKFQLMPFLMHQEIALELTKNIQTSILQMKWVLLLVSLAGVWCAGTRQTCTAKTHAIQCAPMSARKSMLAWLNRLKVSKLWVQHNLPPVAALPVQVQDDQLLSLLIVLKKENRRETTHSLFSRVY